MEAQTIAVENPFAKVEAQLDALKGRLASPEAGHMTHSEIEVLIEHEGRELLRQLFQAHLDLRAPGTVESGTVKGADGVLREHERRGGRGLTTLFGPVVVQRTGYRTPEGEGETVYPLDAELNLPRERYSFGVQKRVAIEVSKNSFDEAVQAMGETTGARVPKRQVEEIAQRAAADFDVFYDRRSVGTVPAAEATGSILVISADAKGVVMRRQDLREATRKAAERRRHKLQHRLAKGEKRNAKRMAEVATVYTVQPYVRVPEDIVRELRAVEDAKVKAKRPRPENKRVWASLSKDPAEVIGDAFDEALRRDPERLKKWVALVDGNETQLEILRHEAQTHGIALTIILDLIHVLGYLWKAALVFCAEGCPEAEAWVTERLLHLLEGKASDVAAGIRRSATLRELSAKDREAADDCADYLLKYTELLRYDEYLAAGLPIATGVIEGACRHLVKDRMDVTGARWSLRGAEAVLRLRSLRTSSDFDEYWAFHEQQELRRNHLARFATEVPRTRGLLAPKPVRPTHLRVVK